MTDLPEAVLHPYIQNWAREQLREAGYEVADETAVSVGVYAGRDSGYVSIEARIFTPGQDTPWLQVNDTEFTRMLNSLIAHATGEAVSEFIQSWGAGHPTKKEA